MALSALPHDLSGGLRPAFSGRWRLAFARSKSSSGDPRSYSTRTRLAASFACSKVSATTTAIGSPL